MLRKIIAALLPFLPHLVGSVLVACGLMRPSLFVGLAGGVLALLLFLCGLVVICLWFLAVDCLFIWLFRLPDDQSLALWVPRGVFWLLPCMVGSMFLMPRLVPVMDFIVGRGPALGDPATAFIVMGSMLPVAAMALWMVSSIEAAQDNAPEPPSNFQI